MTSHSFIFNVHQPVKNKSCTELEQHGKYGWLRKKRTRIFRRLEWERKRIVLTDGCLYIFKNESSQSYEKAFSLFGYNEISRAQEVPTMDTARNFPFKICYALDSKEQVKYFSAESEEDRLEWMRAIRHEMLKVHNIKASIESDPSCDSTEVPISTITFFEEIKNNNQSYRDCSWNDSDLESEYHYPEDEIPTIPQPPIMICVPPPTPPKKPSLESVARWIGTPGAGKRILVKYGCEGSYMIRSSTHDSDVLLVISEYFARKYKIFKNNNKLYLLLNDKHFDSIDSLIIHYKSHPLPNTQTMLKDPYRNLTK